MPVVNINGVGEVTFPDSWSQDQIIRAIETDIIPNYRAPAPEKPITYTEAFKGGAKRLAGSAQTAFGALTGDEQQAAAEGLARQQAIIERGGVSLEKAKEAFGQGIIPGVKEVGRQIPYAVAEQLPNLGATIAGARLGALGGGMVGGVPGAFVGGLAGAFAPSLITQAGSNIERQAQEGQPISTGSAFGAAVPQAALDVFADKTLFGRLMGIPPAKLGTEAAEALAKQSLKRTLASGTVKGVLAEVPTEVAQQMLERYQAGLSITDDDARKEYIDTAYQTALLGPLGAIGNIQERSEARDTVAQAQEAQRQATGVMEQQPLFTPEAAPVPAAPQEAPVAQDNIPEPTLSIPEAEPEQLALFGPRGGVTQAAKDSVRLAKQQGKEAEAAAQPVMAEPTVVEPEPLPEGTLTPGILREYGITPRMRDFYKALVGTNLANPMTYQMLVQAAQTGTERGIRANRLLDAFPQFKPQVPAVPELEPSGGPAYAPEAQPEQRDLFGIQEDGLRTEAEPTGVERGLEQPVPRDTTQPTAVGEPTGRGLGAVSQPVVGGDVQPEAGPEAQPSALVPPSVQATQAKAAARAMKKEPVSVVWAYMSDTPYAKLSKVAKERVRDAHAQGYLTQELADEVEAIERKNARTEAANAAVKPELDEDVSAKAEPKPVEKLRDLSSTEQVILEEYDTLASIYDRIINVLPISQAQKNVNDSVDRWVEGAKSGLFGKFDPGEIEATANGMRQDPLGYQDSFDMDQATIDALNFHAYGKIDGLSAKDIEKATASMNTELRAEQERGTALKQGNYRSVVEKRIADGTIPKKSAPLFNAILDNDSNAVYDWIKSNALNKNYRIIAKLLKRANIIPLIEFGETRSETALAHYDPAEDKVVVDIGNYLQETASTQEMAATILHEVMHSATVNKLSRAFFTMTEMSKGWVPAQPYDKKYIASAEFQAAKNLFDTFDWLAKNHPDIFAAKKHYGATDPLELTAEIFVDPTLYKTLATIKLPSSLVLSGSTNALTRIINQIKRLLGISAAPDSAVAVVMRDTLALISARKPYASRIKATTAELMGLSDLQKKYNSSEEIAYNPQAQAQAQQLINNMSGTLIQSPRTPTPTPSQVAQNVVKTAVQNPSGAFRMIENGIAKVRTLTADKGAYVADQIRDFHDGAFYGVNGTIREDMLLSAEANTGNYIDSYFNFGGIDILKNGAIQVTDSDYSVDNIYKSAKQLADRIGVDTAKELITKAFYHYRAAAIKAMPKDQWPENWQQDPRIVPTQQQIQAGLDAFARVPELEDMRRQFIGSKNNIVKFLNKAGFLTDGKTKEYLADDSYAPWMRIKEYQDKAPGMGNIGRMVDLSQMKKLVGGTEEVNDMLENMAQMLAWGVRSGIKNHTANSALGVMEQMGTAVKSAGRPGNVDPAHVVMTYVAGKPTYWQVDNPYDLAAFQSVKALDSSFMRQIAKWMATLRAGIVLFPVFPIRQVIMDSQRAYMQAGVERPLAMVGKIFKAFLTGEAYKEISEDAETLRKYGVAAQVDYFTHDETRGLAEKYGLKERESGITNWWVRTPAYQALHKFAYSADLAVRLGIYRQTMEETGDQTLAATRAREIINFQKSGTSAAMITLKQAIPFLGAYLQGMDVNYRSMIGRGNSMKQRKAAAAAYWSNAAMYAGLVIAYTMAMSGDDEYEEQKGFVTDRNFLIPGGGLLPVPPDAGFIPKVVTERITDYILQESTDNPESAERLKQGLLEAAYAAYLPPAAVYGVTPIIELSTNKSFFSNMPIVGEYYQGLKPSEQYTPRTSEFAKAVGQAADMSPIQIDYVLNAIGGTTAGALLQLGDVMMGSEKTAPEKLPVVGTFQQKPVGGRYMEEYYAVREMTTEAYNTIRAMVERGEIDKADEYAARPEIQARLAARSGIEKVHTMLNQVSEAKNAIDNNKELSPEQRRMMIDELYTQVEQALKGMGIRQVRKELE